MKAFQPNVRNYVPTPVYEGGNLDSRGLRSLGVVTIALSPNAAFKPLHGLPQERHFAWNGPTEKFRASSESHRELRNGRSQLQPRPGLDNPTCPNYPKRHSTNAIYDCAPLIRNIFSVSRSATADDEVLCPKAIRLGVFAYVRAGRKKSGPRSQPKPQARTCKRFR